MVDLQLTRKRIENTDYLEAPNGALFLGMPTIQSRPLDSVVGEGDFDTALEIAERTSRKYNFLYVTERGPGNPNTRVSAEPNLALQLNFYQELLTQMLDETGVPIGDPRRIGVRCLAENTDFPDLGLEKTRSIIDLGFATRVRYKSPDGSATFTPAEASEMRFELRYQSPEGIVALAEKYVGEIEEGKGNQGPVAGRALFVAELAERRLGEYDGKDKPALLTRAQLVSVNASRYLHYHTDSFAEGAPWDLGDDPLELL